MKFRKVCFFLPSGYRDGAELSALECLEALRALGIQCQVILPQSGSLRADLKARGIPYQIIPVKVWNPLPPVHLKPVLWLCSWRFWDLVVF